MSFESSTWLWLIAPWALLAVWLLWRQRRAMHVPFVELWRAQTPPPAEKRSLRPPPLAVVAVLAAMLLAILAAARPTLLSDQHDQTVTVIFDNGVTLCGEDRRRDVIEQAKRAIEQLHADHVTLITLPGGEACSSTPKSWPDLLGAPSVIDTSSILRRTVSAALAESDAPVMFLSDRLVPIADPRLISITPTRPLQNAGIVRFAIAEQPHPQAMVTVRNDSQESRAILRVDNATQAIDLPPAGAEKNYFLDLPAAGRTVQAKLEVADDCAADNVATLTRQREWPKIEIRGSLPPEVRRVVEAYQSFRPVGGSATLTVSPEPIRDAGVVVSTTGLTDAGSPLTVKAHPVTANLEVAKWQDVSFATPPSGEGWSAVISAGDHPIVSVREHPARQVWIGFTSSDLPRTTDFVVLWTSALDWLAGGAGATEAFAADPPIVHVPLRPASRSDWQSKVAALSRRPPGGIDLSPYLVIASAASILVAACLWPRRILTAFSGPRTV